IPFAALMVPLYRMFGSISTVAPFIGMDTLVAVMLPTLTTAFLIFFFRQNTKMFSKELIEAGRIDGLSELGIFFRIYMPTMKTTYAAAAIITFMNSWNNYLWPLVVLQSPEKQTIPLLISNLGSSYSPDYGVIMLTIVIAT
ncbi:carbohydrate ABC transporter permease, partial [Microvirga sp. 3-52]|nr:carbohydrate ABC transporter permease [Microvirga sp. 3-52]